MNEGLKHKYNITKTDGSEIHPEAKYFVLRLDTHQEDRKHLQACMLAIMQYALAIDNPKLREDIYTEYTMPYIEHLNRLINEQQS